MSSMWAFVAVSIHINIFLNMIHFTTFGMHKISLWLVLKKILPTYKIDLSCMEFLVTLVDFQVLQQHKIPGVLRVYYFT